jgi:prolyl 4-hydroxylase
MHRDGSYKRNETEKSFFTFLIYLNDDFEGGETEFQDLFTIKPKTGDLLVFYHPYKHEGKLLVSGYKYALRSDVMYRLNE